MGATIADLSSYVEMRMAGLVLEITGGYVECKGYIDDVQRSKSSYRAVDTYRLYRGAPPKL